jgi:hypothetical protein
MKNRLLLSISALFGLVLNLTAATRYVDLSSLNPVPPFTSWATAATNIQDAIDAAADGDVVVVTNGVYATGGRAVYLGFTNRVALTKPITVQSANGPHWTTIRGAQVPGSLVGSNAVRCAYLTNGAMLVGFTLTNGAAGEWDAGLQGSGGGVWCESTNATVSNCVLVANASEADGGGAYRGLLLNCQLLANSATAGGGAAFSTLNGCILISNTVSVYGGGAISCVMSNCYVKGNVSALGGGGVMGGTLIQCLLIDNRANNLGGGAQQSTLDYCTLSNNVARIRGGGAYLSKLYGTKLIGNFAASGGGASESTLQSCALTRNVATNAGGGTYLSISTNCTITANIAQTGGGASGGTNRNCILYNNYASSSGDNYYFSTLSFCCTTPLPDSSAGNMALPPGLVSDTHLSVASPCRFAGNPQVQPSGDIDGEGWANPPSIGCDEVIVDGLTTLQGVGMEADATYVATNFEVSFAALIQGRAQANRWDFGDGTVISNQAYVAHSWMTPGLYQVTLTAYADVPPSGNSATQLVEVVNALHCVSTSSTQPLSPYTSWSTAATNIQDAVDAASVSGALILVSNGVYRFGGRAINSMSNRVAILKPVTVQSLNGPGVTQIVGSRSVGVRCAYLTNGAELIGFTLTNGGTLGGGSSEFAGAGVRCQSVHALVSNCIIRSNVASSTGGGGAYGGMLKNCVITDNVGAEGAGANRATLINCVLRRNSGSHGGGAYGSELYNSTVAGNSASSGGGGVDNSTVRNSIVFYNSSSTGPNSQSSTFDYCCTTPMPAGGQWNTTSFPRFVDPVGDLGDLRLQSNSPCIGSGNNSYVQSAFDLDGLPRVIGGAVDVGAYEFQSPSSVLPFVWAERYGIPTDGSADFADGDSDGMNNYGEWRSDTIPTNALSVLRMMSATNGAMGANVTWQSVATRSYWLERATNLGGAPSFRTVATNIAGAAGTKTFTDISATNGGPYFYRVGVQ